MHGIVEVTIKLTILPEEHGLPCTDLTPDQEADFREREARFGGPPSPEGIQRMTEVEELLCRLGVWDVPHGPEE